MSPYRLFPAVLALALVAPAAAAATSDDALVWVDHDTLTSGAGRSGVAPGHEVLVDAAAGRLAAAGAPVESTNGDVALAAGDERVVLDPPSRPGAVSLSFDGLVAVLPDGYAVPLSLGHLTVGFDSEGRDAITVDGLAVGAVATSTPVAAAALDAAPAAASSGGLVAPGGANGALAAATGPTDAAPGREEPVRPAARPAAATSSDVAPSAVALAPVPTGNVAVAVAASAVALGALLALWPLYHRISGARTLESATRKRIYDVVCDRPGVGVAEAAMKGAVSYSTATYHLDRLVKEGMLVASNEGGRLRYYKNGGFNEDDRKLVALLSNREVMRLLDVIRANPGTYRAALADALNVTTTTINWHLKRLVAAGLVREERRGRSAHLFAVEDRLVAELAPLSERVQVAGA